MAAVGGGPARRPDRFDDGLVEGRGRHVERHAIAVRARQAAELMGQKLIYSPGACSLVTHIALVETGAEYDPVRVTLAHGEHLNAEFLAINPHARVPALATDGG